jgi:hypothetical protein
VRAVHDVLRLVRIARKAPGLLRYAETVLSGGDHWTSNPALLAGFSPETLTG